MKKRLSKQLGKVDKQESSLDIEIIDTDTVFKIVRNEDRVSIVMGDQIMMRNLESIEKAKKVIEEKPWELILTASAMYTEFINNVKKEEV